MDGVSALSLLAGQQLGGLGSTQVAAVLVGGLFVAFRRAARWEIIITFLCGVALTGSIFWLIDPDTYIRPELYFPDRKHRLCNIFLVTDSSSSPVGTVGMIIFGLLAGSLQFLSVSMEFTLTGLPLLSWWLT